MSVLAKLRPYQCLNRTGFRSEGVTFFFFKFSCALRGRQLAEERQPGLLHGLLGAVGGLREQKAGR